jgi:serine/threonine protein kinase
MEYLELGDLHQYVSNSPLISEVDAAIITWQILDGLSLMHDHNFSHRDIKPQVQKYSTLSFRTWPADTNLEHLDQIYRAVVGEDWRLRN